MDEGVMFTAATAVTFGTTTLLMALAVRWALRKHARATSHDDDDDVDGGDAGPRSPGEQFLFDCEQPAAVDAVKEHLASDAGLVEAHPGCVHAAVASGSLAILQLVLRAATPVFRENLANARSQGTGVTPLIVAADRGLWEHAELLLDSGADANRADASGHTPLFLAACNGHDDLVRLLLERGSNPFAVNKTRKSALHFAAHNEHNDVVKQLLDAAFKARPASGRSDLLQQADVSGYTALHSACVRGAPATAKVLIDAGADVNTTARDGSTPLAVACRSQNASDMVQLLLDHGSHIQGVNTFGRRGTVRIENKCLWPERLHLVVLPLSSCRWPPLTLSQTRIARRSRSLPPSAPLPDRFTRCAFLLTCRRDTPPRSVLSG
eukprot:m.270732 g.270732  ORF g.270732 m.270732 type:complete len:380 (-) comp19317_c0_seq14:2459-3598(-)